MTTPIVLGLLYSTHLATPELDRFHPVVEYGNVMYYRNSFGRDSLALYKKYSAENLSLRLGITTGYEREIRLGKDVYITPGTIDKNLTLLVVPSYDLNIKDNVGMTFSLMGSALVTGLTVSF
jgi:hypothetical protein